ARGREGADEDPEIQLTSMEEAGKQSPLNAKPRSIISRLDGRNSTSLRSWWKNVWQKKDFQARFSGRQTDEARTLSPAKAGWCFKKGAEPGFRSLRSLHPGLHSAASFAGSLRSFSPNGVRRSEARRVGKECSMRREVSV